jgi:hypothetical protein
MKRWQLLLLDFNIELNKIAGKENTVADQLSRLFIMKEEKLSKEERFSNNIKVYLTDETKEDGRRIVKEEKSSEFIKYIHRHLGHVGITKTYNSIKNYFYINDVKNKITKVLEGCRKCNLYKIKLETKKPKVSIESKGIFDKISTDVYGPIDLENIFDEEEYSKGYYITITDIYSRISCVHFTYKVTATEIIRCLKKWFKKYQKPSTIISDNGTEYRNSKMEAFMKSENIVHSLIPTYAPYSNGISEAINKTITEMIKMYGKHGIKKITRKINWRLNETINRTLEIAPMSLWRGYNFYDPNKTPVTMKIGNVQSSSVKAKYQAGQEV